MSDRESRKGPLDPIFGQHSVFSLSEEGVDPSAVQYLKHVRAESLTTIVSECDEADFREPLSIIQNQSSENNHTDLLVENPDLVNEWIDELRNEMEPLDENISAELYDETMLDILVYEVKRYLDQHPEEKNDAVRRVTRDVSAPLNPAYEIQTELVKAIIIKLRNKRFSDIHFLKKYINRPMPIPSNFRQWFGHIKHNEPTRQFMLRLSFEDLMKVIGYMMQWVIDISKDKPGTANLQQWLLYLWIFMPTDLLSHQVSQMRELGKKCRGILNKKASIPALTLPKEISDIPFPDQRDRLNAIDISLVAIAYRFGQRDLLEI